MAVSFKSKDSLSKTGIEHTRKNPSCDGWRGNERGMKEKESLVLGSVAMIPAQRGDLSFNLFEVVHEDATFVIVPHRTFPWDERNTRYGLTKEKES